MNYKRLDPLGRGYKGSHDGIAIWWCGLLKLFELLGSRELTGKAEIWTSRRGKELDSRRGEEF